MRLELTIDIPEGTSPELFVSSLQDRLAYHTAKATHLAGVQVLRCRVIEDPDPNEEHSGDHARA
jgi:hypothetical protein